MSKTPALIQADRQLKSAPTLDQVHVIRHNYNRGEEPKHRSDDEKEANEREELHPRHVLQVDDRHGKHKCLQLSVLYTIAIQFHLLCETKCTADNDRIDALNTTMCCKNQQARGWEATHLELGLEACECELLGFDLAAHAFHLGFKNVIVRHRRVVVVAAVVVRFKCLLVQEMNSPPAHGTLHHHLLVERLANRVEGLDQIDAKQVLVHATRGGPEGRRTTLRQTVCLAYLCCRTVFSLNVNFDWPIG
jgi:hypothetical protein